MMAPAAHAPLMNDGIPARPRRQNGLGVWHRRVPQDEHVLLAARGTCSATSARTRISSRPRYTLWRVALGWSE
jgi:hypothetical protein